jgi:crotonobetainyl-CoA:carnitine CoA-transferase CaiB-like acyl-CoA transferase
MHETPPSYRMPPPLLGEHTDEILSKKIGLSEAEIKNLKDNEII